MTEAEMKRAIATRWLDAWPAASGGVATVLDNEAADEAAELARVSVLTTTSSQDTLGTPGNRKHRRWGSVKVKLCSAPDVGTERNDELVDAVREVLESRRLGATALDGGVVTQAASSRPIGVEGQFFVSIVDVPFYYYETR